MDKNTDNVAKRHIKSGDTVKVIAGDDKGKTGKVVKIITAKNRALVEGLNMVKRHTKPSASNPEGGIIPKEMPIDISNLAFIDPANGQVTKVGRKLNKDGKLERFSKKTGLFFKVVLNNRMAVF